MTLKETIRKIWGISSQKILAERMAVSDRKVRHWIADDTTPDKAWDAVREGLDEKIAELTKLRKDIKDVSR